MEVSVQATLTFWWEHKPPRKSNKVWNTKSVSLDNVTTHSDNVTQNNKRRHINMYIYLQSTPPKADAATPSTE